MVAILEIQRKYTRRVNSYRYEVSEQSDRRLGLEKIAFVVDSARKSELALWTALRSGDFSEKAGGHSWRVLVCVVYAICAIAGSFLQVPGKILRLGTGKRVISQI